MRLEHSTGMARKKIGNKKNLIKKKLTMAKVEPFEIHSDAYDRWFLRNAEKYALELEALKQLVAPGGVRCGLEVGVGSGKLAVPLGFATGVEPAAAMVHKAAARGITVVRGVA